MLSGCATYRAGVALPDTDTPVSALSAAGRGRLVWISLHDPSQEEAERLASVLHLDPDLAAALADQAPRVALRTLGGTALLTCGVARYDPVHDLVEFGSLTCLATPEVLITVTRHAPADVAELRRSLEAQEGALSMGPGHVVHHLLQAVVAGYADVLRQLRGDVEKLELEAFSEDVPEGVTQRIYLLKREAIDFRHATAALIDPLDDLATGREVVPGDHSLPEWGRLRDRLSRLVDRSDVVSDLLTGILTAYQTEVALQQNEDMRKISAWVAIAAVPTMLAGVYGMNFEHMPELSSPYGYPAVLLVMVTACALLHRIFRRRGWL